MSASDPKQISTGILAPLLTGPFQMVGMVNDADIIPTFGYVGRSHECPEKPAPCPNEFGDDP
jgi:hypothetical protein